MHEGEATGEHLLLLAVSPINSYSSVGLQLQEMIRLQARRSLERDVSK